MGAEETPDSFYSVLFAVLAHKCLEAFALGLSIFYAKFSKTVTFFMIFGYSVATPLGVLAGVSFLFPPFSSFLSSLSLRPFLILLVRLLFLSEIENQFRIRFYTIISLYPRLLLLLTTTKMITSSLSSDQNLMAGILVSLASGSFLYISVIEILPTELHKPHVMALKLFAMIFGWFAMVILAYFV